MNNAPSRATGYSSFYLNYGYHPLHPLQLFHSPKDTSIEAVAQFTSRTIARLHCGNSTTKKSTGANGTPDRPAQERGAISGGRYGITEH